jgi:hypothetical protein
VRDALDLHVRVGADGDGQSFVDSIAPKPKTDRTQRALGWRSPRWMEVGGSPGR